MRAQLERAIAWCKSETDPEPTDPKRLANIEMYQQSMLDADQPLEAARYAEKVKSLKAKLGL